MVMDIMHSNVNTCAEFERYAKYAYDWEITDSPLRKFAVTRAVAMPDDELQILMKRIPGVMKTDMIMELKKISNSAGMKVTEAKDFYV